MKLLVTAFEAFGGESVNPAKHAVKRLGGEDVIKLFLPVEYENAARMTLENIALYRPDAVINVGQAGGRDAVCPERYAVNLRSSKSPDGAGRLCLDEEIIPGGDARLESSFDADKIAAAINAGCIPARVSESAGTYVCNELMYRVLWFLKGSGVPAGFIHVPFCDEQAAGHPGAFTLSAGEISRALALALETVKQGLLR